MMLKVLAIGLALSLGSYFLWGSVGASGSVANEGTTVLLCDGETSITFPESAESLPQTRENGQTISSALMDEWLKKNPDAQWEMEVRERHMIKPSADNSDLVAENAQSGGNTYGAITDRDVLMWKRETERMVVEGARIFHSGNELGSTIAVSCDMCHPDASNTHPETYPKFQRQIGKTVLLRDMINWCIEHPVRGEKLDTDSDALRAIEAYVLAQRTGTPLEYGKH